MRIQHMDRVALEMYAEALECKLMDLEGDNIGAPIFSLHGQDTPAKFIQIIPWGNNIAALDEDGQVWVRMGRLANGAVEWAPIG